MSCRHFLMLPLILTLLLFPPLAAAQQPNPSDKTETDDTALREKAFDLLESLVDQIGTLQSAENRARLLSNIAGSLWTHDEKRARAVLASVENDIKAGLQNSLAEEPADIQTFNVFLQLRYDTVERIAQYDPELALAFHKSTTIVSEKPLPGGVSESERNLEMRLAKEIAAKNPEMALQLGRRSLERGVSYDLLTLLAQLKRKNKDLATTFYQEIVSKLRTSNFRDWQVRSFAQNLARRFNPAPDNESFRELVNILITSALENGCGKTPSEANDRSYCYEIGSLVPVMLKVDRFRAAPLERWTPKGEQIESEPYYDEAYAELRELAEEGSVDDILRLASKYPQIAAEGYWQAIIKAERSGDFDQARKIANDYVTDRELRKMMLARIDQEQKAVTINDERLAEIQRDLGKIPRPEDKLRLLVQVAYRLTMTDRKMALKLLNQASAIAETIKPGREQTEAQIGLAMMYCSLKSDRGFVIMESLIPKLNELITAAMKLDRYDNVYVRDGEWNMTGYGGLGSLLTTLAREARYFAWCDFDRAVSLAAQFERPEIRIMAQLKLAQGILAGPSNRLTGNVANIR